MAKRENKMFNKKMTKSPISIQIELTKKCNLNCFYCGINELIKKEDKQELDTQEWKNLLHRLKEIQVFDISLTGGEIFLRDDIFEILEVAKKNNFPTIRLTSNGTLINKTIANKLKNLNFLNIEISIDGDRNTHDQIRGKGSFDRVIKGICDLIDNGIYPKVRFTPLKNNYKKLKVLVDILYPLGIKKFVLNSLKITSKCYYKNVMLDPFVETNEFEEIIYKVKEKYPDVKIGKPDTFYKNLPIQYYKNKEFLNNMAIKKLKPCSAAHSSCYITSDGWIIPCSGLYDFKGGNIKEKDILDIWRNSINFKKIRNLSNLSLSQIPYCRNCNYNRICSAGCRANAYAAYSDLTAPDPFCPYWKEN
ncbi:MAG: radical SAM protein [Promethearchaeota archaeon]